LGPAGNAAANFASNNPAYVGGRFGTGAAISLFAGPALGTSLTFGAMMGDALHNIDRYGAASAAEVLRGMMGDRPQRGSGGGDKGCSCQD
jgi:hypothetical protein